MPPPAYPAAWQTCLSSQQTAETETETGTGSEAATIAGIRLYIESVASYLLLDCN